MPEVKPRDYTTGELDAAADVCRDAADLLAPTADELTHIAESLEPERADEALHLRRTSRDLLGGALHLTVGERTIRRVIKQVGRTYDSIVSRLYLLASVGFLVSGVLGLVRVFIPDSIGRHIDGLIEWPIQYGTGFAGGALFSLATLKSRIRRQPRDP